jgi:hypothetical protein
MSGQWKPETIARRAEQKRRWAEAPTIRCSCGAVWQGRATIDNPVIEAHRTRPTCDVTVEQINKEKEL